MLEKAVGVNYSIDQFLSAYIAATQKAICELASQYNEAAKYDKPCCSYEENIKKGLFIKFALENINCFTDDEKNKVVSLANRFAKNCSSCTVSQDEIDALAQTSFGKSISNSFSLDPDVKAFVDALGLTDDGEITALNDLVTGLKTSNLWSKFHAIYPFVGYNLTDKKYNLVNPAKHTIDWASGAINDSLGVDFDGGLNGYGDTNLNLSSIGYTDIEDLHISFYTPDNRDLSVRNTPFGVIAESGSSDDRITMVFDSTALGGNYFVDFWADNDSSARIGISSGIDAGDKGYYIISTLDNSDLRLRKDKAQIGAYSLTRDINPIPNLDLYLGAINVDGSTSASTVNSRKLGFFTVGTNLTNSEADTLHNLVLTYLNTVGRV